MTSILQRTSQAGYGGSIPLTRSTETAVILRAACRTAVADELVVRNPCRVEGCGVEHSAERPIATVAEVDALADGVGDRWRLFVLLAAWTSLRLGELAALTRGDLDLLRRTVTVTKNRQRLVDGSTVLLLPKSAETLLDGCHPALPARTDERDQVIADSLGELLKPASVEDLEERRSDRQTNAEPRRG